VKPHHRSTGRGSDPRTEATTHATDAALRRRRRRRERGNGNEGCIPEVGETSKRKARGTRREQRRSASNAARGALRLFAAASSGWVFMAAFSGHWRPPVIIALPPAPRDRRVAGLDLFDRFRAIECADD
jgi:hypothetical protein